MRWSNNEESCTHSTAEAYAYYASMQQPPCVPSPNLAHQYRPRVPKEDMPNPNSTHFPNPHVSFNLSGSEMLANQRMMPRWCLYFGPLSTHFYIQLYSYSYTLTQDFCLWHLFTFCGQFFFHIRAKRKMLNM